MVETLVSELRKALREPKKLEQILDRIGADFSGFELSRDDYNSKGRTNHKGILHCAVLGGCEESVKILLARGAVLDDLDEEGRTPFLQACMEGFERIVEILIDHGANVGVQDADGFNGAHWAYCMGHTELGDWLLSEGGVDGKQVDCEGRVPEDLLERDSDEDSQSGLFDEQKGAAGEKAKSSAYVINGEVNNFAAGSGFRAIKWLAVNMDEGGVFPCDQR